MYRIVSIVLMTSFLFAIGGPKGSKKLFSLSTAKTASSGGILISSGMNFFTQAFSSDVNLQNVSSFNYWQVDGDVSMTYGITDDIDIILNARLYQDTQQQDNNFPSYISADLKYGNIDIVDREFQMAITTGFQFGLGKYRNLPFEDYVSEGITIKPELTFSYYLDKFLPDRSLSFHVSAGVDLHFDNGKAFKDIDEEEIPKTANTENTTRLNYGLGVNVPTGVIDIMFELSGYSFITEPSLYAYGREDRIVANAVFRYKMSPFLSFDFGFGFDLSNGEESTLSITTDQVLDPDNSFVGYSTWRGFLSVNFDLQPSSSYGQSRVEMERNQYERKVQTLQELIQEQENTEMIENELENLKKERERAEKELEELKKILED